jgi:hypothetical protein
MQLQGRVALRKLADLQPWGDGVRRFSEWMRYNFVGRHRLRVARGTHHERFHVAVFTQLGTKRASTSEKAFPARFADQTDATIHDVRGQTCPRGAAPTRNGAAAQGSQG